LHFSGSAPVVKEEENEEENIEYKVNDLMNTAIFILILTHAVCLSHLNASRVSTLQILVSTLSPLSDQRTEHG